MQRSTTLIAMTHDAELIELLRTVGRGESLDAGAAHRAFAIIMTGRASKAQVAALLTALSVRTGGPTVDEITGAAQVMRQHVTRVDVPEGLTVIDTCGTGGDGCGTFNVSTTAAIIAAGAGAAVAKHGNKSVTSKSGSSQVLEHLGVKLQVTGHTLSRCLAEARICFCFAPAHHPAMKHVATIRPQLGFRTIFNLLGPLTNPAGTTRQVMGVYDADLTEPIAHVLDNLGSQHAMVVHGTTLGAIDRTRGGNGLDEITTTGPTRITTLHHGRIETSELHPADLDLPSASLADLAVDDVEASAAVVRRVLTGEPGPARDIAALNAAAALVVADLAVDLKQGLELARQAVDSGAAQAALDNLVEITNRE